ncbi:MAG: ATP-binding protein [Bacilli bacterium]|jgi:ABC-type dipeptide/oligopeptide/nickel transport system ATPase component
MIGKILFIDDNSAKVSLNIAEGVMENIINIHLVFEDDERRILGEITTLENDIVTVQFLGEFKEDSFISGIIRKPKLAAKVRIISKEELAVIMSHNDPKTFAFGKSVLYKNYPVYVNIDDLFSNHLAIFGNTGSGKSYGVTKILQSLFYNEKNIAVNSTFFIFDVHGEYNNAFKNLNEFNNNYQYKMFRTNNYNLDGEMLTIPLWLLDIEDIALLLGATEYSQLVIIEKALLILSVLTERSETTTKYKNHLIAKSIQTILYSNLSATKIRSEVFEILSICSTDELNLNALIPGIGYTRDFKRCFDINKMGTFAENVLIHEYINQFIDEELEKKVSKKINKCTLNDLEDALNFVIISENILVDDQFYNQAMMLKLKLRNLIVKGYGRLFDFPEYLNKESYLTKLMIKNNRRSQLININLEGLNANIAYFVTHTLAKLIFDFISSLENRASVPIHFLIEEAHHFIKNKDNPLYGENVFEQIAKEGRKYGVIITLISQRPTELSETALSQCSSFLLFRTNHPRDLEYMKRAIPNVNTDIIEKQRSVQPGYCVGLGKVFKIPLIVKLDLPNPPPHSSNALVYNIWSGNNNKAI